MTWTKGLPKVDGDYFCRLNEHDLCPVSFRLENGKIYEYGCGGNLYSQYVAKWDDYEYLGPFSAPDAEQLMELRQIERELDEANIPKEVWIGTDSTADRVTWLITRNKLNQQNSRSRLKTMNELADLVEEMLTAGDPSNSWWNRAEEVLVAAGRRGALNPKQPGKETKGK